MSEDQIKIILKRLNEQDKDNLEYRKEREKIDDERFETLNKLQESIKPLLNFITSARNIDKLLIYVVRTILMIGGVITAIGVIVIALRKLLTNHW